MSLAIHPQSHHQPNRFGRWRSIALRVTRMLRRAHSAPYACSAAEVERVCAVCFCHHHVRRLYSARDLQPIQLLCVVCRVYRKTNLFLFSLLRLEATKGKPSSAHRTKRVCVSHPPQRRVFSSACMLVCVCVGGGGGCAVIFLVECIPKIERVKFMCDYRVTRVFTCSLQKCVRDSPPPPPAQLDYSR